MDSMHPAWLPSLSVVSYNALFEYMLLPAFSKMCLITGFSSNGMSCGEVKSHLCHVEACVAVCAVSGGLLQECCQQPVQTILLSDHP